MRGHVASPLSSIHSWIASRIRFAVTCGSSDNSMNLSAIFACCGVVKRHRRNEWVQNAGFVLLILVVTYLALLVL